MELLTRFELVTSSLPNPRLLIFPLISYRHISPQTQSYQSFSDFSCFLLPYLVGPSLGLFFYVCRSFGRSFLSLELQASQEIALGLQGIMDIRYRQFSSL